ncbi:hypothetical protein KY360_04740 [Candidatus Woesearchaeota archaeon]|nr:hypothetical protein [Candidatus Woesearchaeota archaeon]
MKKGSGKEKLPRWKKTVDDFNIDHFEKIERFVKKAIPWLVLLLLFIILGEFAGGINRQIVARITGHESHFLEQVVEFMHHYHTWVIILDEIIIAFFVLDLYFNFFKSVTFGRFVKKYFLDIIAVTPVGLFFRGSEAVALAGDIGLGQEITHVATETERAIVEGERIAKEGEKIVKEGERIAKVVEAEKAAKATRLSRTARAPRLARLARLPRLVRLWRLKTFFKKKK